MWASAEKPLGALSSVRGADEIGPVSTTASYVVVYIKCYGTGVVTVDVVGSAKMTQQCLTDETDPGTRNQIQVLNPEEVTVRGTAENSNMWAIAVTEGDDAN
ncbi:hypothetical protein F6W69_06370 [Microbacterium oxydans]|uniref:hypothetical protein n=1 Tax=Microbacterium oxydans TaxID=82380 RepID=UPI001141774D|nr:hypothetical protein [Microbacterium oxydans]KAB1893643.1 hypothetical protein F6W69_06370 [Microbacterium oxydans]GED38147.1 hypothetical protein MOX01_12890 [Microbacterium oxydans]